MQAEEDCPALRVALGSVTPVRASHRDKLGMIRRIRIRGGIRIGSLLIQVGGPKCGLMV